MRTDSLRVSVRRPPCRYCCPRRVDEIETRSATWYIYGMYIYTVCVRAEPNVPWCRSLDGLQRRPAQIRARRFLASSRSFWHDTRGHQGTPRDTKASGLVAGELYGLPRTCAPCTFAPPRPSSHWPRPIEKISTLGRRFAPRSQRWLQESHETTSLQPRPSSSKITTLSRRPFTVSSPKVDTSSVRRTLNHGMESKEHRHTRLDQMPRRGQNDDRAAQQSNTWWHDNWRNVICVLGCVVCVVIWWRLIKWVCTKLFDWIERRSRARSDSNDSLGESLPR
jgi:hypothetical protein